MSSLLEIESSAKLIIKEEVVYEKCNWVRFISQCNNKCIFCFDILVHNGTMGTESEIKLRIVEGCRNGAMRLILSGGELIIYLYYVKFIKYGCMAGYWWIQIVINGRMFFYLDFLECCIDAGF